jgi:hypothetical protein
MKGSIFSGKIGAKPGVALVIVISLIAMLTVVTVALLLIVGQSTQKTANEVAAQQSEALAQTAFEVMLADISDEMARGSGPAVLPEPKRTDGTTYRIYDVSANRKGMRVTSSVLAGAPGANVLVKQSQPTTPFHTWPPLAGKTPLIRASSVGTDSGKTPFNPALWQMPRYLAPTDLFSASTAPRWIYAARNGTNPTTFTAAMRREKLSDLSPNPAFVLGRYAYNLYDTSGMLDINVAGFPSNADATLEPTPVRIGDKGSQLFADISLLPGMTPAKMDQIARWRHLWSPDAKLSDEYIQRSEGRGWRTMFANDNTFLNRQDLLAFWKINSLSNDTLPYLTHFSRDLDAPSYRPASTRPMIARKAADGGNTAFARDNEFNPHLQEFSAANDGPVIRRRFPLERLKYVATPKDNKPLDAATIAKAEKYFGLRWDSTEGVWVYLDTGTDGRICTLANVPSTREPNFFEVLQAAVTAGSLGRQFGQMDQGASSGYHTAISGSGNTAAIASRHYLSIIGGKASLDASTDLQIFELGACIIDQYDEDSFPTTIRFNKLPSSPPPATPYYLTGSEDVPYVQAARIMPFRDKVLPAVTIYGHNYATGAYEPVAGSKAYEINHVLQVRLWRPHQPTDNYEGPTKFRIRPQHADVLAGGVKIWTWSGWNMPGSIPTYEVRHNPGSGHPDRWTPFTYIFPPRATVPCNYCGALMDTAAARLVPPDRDTNTSSGGRDDHLSPQSNGNYTYWNGPNYGTSGITLPLVLDGSQSIMVDLDYANNAFREPQTVHSPEHGGTAGYSVSGSVISTGGKIVQPGLPTSYSNVAGFLVGRSMAAEVDSDFESTGRTRTNMLEVRLGKMHFRSGPIDVIMEYQVPGTSQWRRYQSPEFLFATQPGALDAFGTKAADWNDKAAIYSSFMVDPRSRMWGGVGTKEIIGDNFSPGSYRWPEGYTARHAAQRWNNSPANNLSTGIRAEDGQPLYSTTLRNYYGWNICHWNGSAYANPGNSGWNIHAVLENDDELWLTASAADLERKKKNFSYRDADEVLRFGVAAINEYSDTPLGNPMASRYSISAAGALSPMPGRPLSGRPRVLNRAFRSVGDLGYAFRGTPWRNIEFLHSTSPDAALLDVFSLYEELDSEGNEGVRTVGGSSSTPGRIVAPVVAGRVNLNSAGIDVVAALLKGSSRDKGALPMDEIEARKVATLFVNAVRGTTPGFQPMVSRAEMVSQRQPDATTTGMVKMLSDSFTNAVDRSIKDRREVVTRALSSGTTVRNWTFMLDLVVQSGRLSPTSASLTDFNAAAERRYWVHFALDRLTGELLDVQWERVAQ